LVLSRFFCFDLLKKYKKVIWHDVDILIQKDFSGLLKYGEKSGFALTLTDSNFYIESNFYRTIPGYSMYTLLYNAGIMVLSDKLKGYEKFTDWCFNKVNELASDLRYMDQGVINLLIQEFSIDIEDIDILKYCCHPDRPECKDADIVHAYGTNKFWNSKKLAERFPEWVANDEEWQLLEGSGLSDDEDRVSVVMSVYDRPDYLIESIDSILSQTHNNLEIIIVVEYSKRQHEINNLIKSIKSDKITIINNKEKLGFAASLNVGIESSTGKYIARMDDDDIAEPIRIERQVKFLNKYLDIGICGSFIQCFGNYRDKWVEVPTNPEACKVQLLFCTALYHPTVMMRRDVIIENNLFYDPNYFTEDYELWSRAIMCTKITNIPEYLLRYRTSNKNITINNSEKVHNSHLQVMKKQFKEYLDLDLSIDELQIINKRIDVTQYTFNRKQALAFRKSVYNKIIRANNKIGFYDKKILRLYLERSNTKHTLVKFSKKAVKRVLRPVRNKLDSFVLYRLRDIDNRISVIESKTDLN
jgi:glycosyltransferase involved in cell wall biosynthesis